MDALIEFIQSKDNWVLITMFWYFLLFDFIRYVLVDLVILIVYLLKKPFLAPKKAEARRHFYLEKPLISVIVPGKNEGKNIPKLIESIQMQTYKNIELIVVDDGSDDNTKDICAPYIKSKLITKFFRAEIRGGKASAANLALRYAKGEYIVHLDADSHLKSDSIEKIILPFFMYDNIGAVAGDIRIRNSSDGLAPTLQTVEYMKSLSISRQVTSTFNMLRIVSGAYGAFKRDVLNQIGGWDIGPGLDGDLTLKIRKLKYKIYFEIEAVCYTSGPDTFTKLAKQRYRWDKSFIRFRLRKHKDLYNIFSSNFHFFNFLSVLENLFYNLILNIKWWIYTIQITFFMTDEIHFILLINYFLYVGANYIEYIIALLFYGDSAKNKDWSYFWAIILMPIYVGIYLRIIRTFSHIMELFFKTSYDDNWNPHKVSSIAKTINM